MQTRLLTLRVAADFCTDRGTFSASPVIDLGPFEKRYKAQEAASLELDSVFSTSPRLEGPFTDERIGWN